MKTVIEDLKREIKNKEEYFNNNMTQIQTQNKKEIESNIINLNSIIDNLIQEKKSIFTENDQIKERLSAIERNHSKKLQNLIDNFEIQRKKDKDAWFLAEQTRRKKWEEKKIDEIKERTRKGLEPEVDQILNNVREEKVKWMEQSKDELRKQKEDLESEFDKKTKDLKAKMLKEKEEALEHERTLFNQRLRNKSEILEDELSEERRRWNINLEAEIQRIDKLKENEKKKSI